MSLPLAFASRAELRRIGLNELLVEQAQWHIANNSPQWREWCQNTVQSTPANMRDITIRFATHLQHAKSDAIRSAQSALETTRTQIAS